MGGYRRDADIDGLALHVEAFLCHPSTLLAKFGIGDGRPVTRDDMDLRRTTDPLPNSMGQIDESGGYGPDVSRPVIP